MAPKRKQATGSASKEAADAPRSKRNKTEAPVNGAVQEIKAEAEALKTTAARAIRKTAGATKTKAATAKAASVTKPKAATASKAKTAAKSTTAKAAAKPKTAVKAKAAAPKAKAATGKKGAPKKAPKADAPPAADLPKRARAPSKKQEEADEAAAAEEKPTISRAAAKPKASAKPKAAAAKPKTTAATKTKAAPKKAAASKGKPAAQEPAAAQKAPAKRRTKAAAKEAEPVAEPVAQDEPEESKPSMTAAKSRKKASTDEPEETEPAAKAPAKRHGKAAAEKPEAEAPEEPAAEPNETKPAAKAPAKRRGKGAAEKPEAEAPVEPVAEPEETKPAAKRSKRAPKTKAAPKEEIDEEQDEAAPMEGVKSAAEQLEKPAAKSKAAAKPTARKRKAAEENAAGDEAPAAEERPAKRRAVAKGKKVEQALQPVEHRSHQKEAGEVFVIGAGDCGQLGMGEDDAEALRARLSSVASGLKVVQVAAGGMHSVALTADGEVYTCGVNDEGALGRETNGAPWENSTMATGNATESYRWAKVEVPTENGNIVQVSAGDSHTMALTEQGFIYGWGTFRNSSGVFSFSAQDRLALRPVLVYTPASVPRQAVKIVSGTDHVLALLRGGALLSWGTGEQGQLGRISAQPPKRHLKEMLLTPAEVTMKHAAKKAAADPVVDIAAGDYSTFAITQSGEVWAWGLNNYGQLAQEGEAPVMAPKKVTALPGAATAVGPGQHHTLFLTGSGQLLSAGRPTYGRLGQQGVDAASDSPAPVPGKVHVQGTGLDSTTVVSIVAGGEVSAAVGADGRAWLWGFGTNSQLGNGADDSDKEVPSLLRSKALQGKRVVQVDFGGQHTLLVVTEDLAGPSISPAAATTGAEAADGASVSMDIDAPGQAEDSAPAENGIFAGGGHAEEAAEDGIAAAEPRQGDPLLQEASAAVPDAAPTEAAGQLSTAPAQPAAPSAVDAPAASLAAPDEVPQVDATAAAGQPAALTHSASGEQPPLQTAAANGCANPAAVLATPATAQGPAPVSVPVAMPMQQPLQALKVGQLQVSQAGGLQPSDAAHAAEAAAAEEVAQMVDSMINVPEAEKASGADHLCPAAAAPAQQMVGPNGDALQDAQPAEALNACSAQTSLLESSAPLSVPASIPGYVPGYVEPVPDQPLQAAAVQGNSALQAAEPASEGPARKSSDLEDWRESFYALSGSKPL